MKYLYMAYKGLRTWFDPGLEGSPYMKNIPSQLDGDFSFSFKLRIGKKFAA